MVGVTSSSLVTPIILHATSVHLLPRGSGIGLTDAVLHETEGSAVVCGIVVIVTFWITSLRS